MSKSVSINPATGETIREYPRISKEKATNLINRTRECFIGWSKTSFDQRAQFMYKAAENLEAGKEQYAAFISNEMGKNYSASISEVEKCVWVLRFFADNAKDFLHKEIVKTEAQESYVTFNPLGVILAIMPWNFPFYQAIRFAAPALMAGNTGLLKHASNVQGCAEAIEGLFINAGFPQYVFTNLNVASEEIEWIIANKNVAAVTLTGSENAGRSVAEIAGRNLKKCVLELGGSDAYIVTDTADLDKAVKLCVKGRLQNNGQTCIAAKRFIVYENIYEAFVEKFTEAMKSAKMGEPFDENTFYGPMSSTGLRNELHQQVQKSVEQGAKLKCGGYIPEGRGTYYPATVLAEVRPGMIAFEEELFGPVAAIIAAKDQSEAIELANNSSFGLGAAIITGDPQQGSKMAADNIEAGSVFVNSIVVSDPRLPFGGIKNSGFGRELSGYGIKEFVNIKTVWVQGNLA